MLELARTAGVEIRDVIIQQRPQPDPSFVIGKGKLEQVVLRALQVDAGLLLFGCDLAPRQMRAITDATDLRVLDRTQLILDIFAQRATSRDGKLQVELAQLKYTLPRLGSLNTGMSRLTGGIGGRGPGETKLELNRRRANERIQKLQQDLKLLSSQRAQRRERRRDRRVPVVAIVGYTNAGKSTLLNTLTQAEVLAEDKLFATLETTTRRLRFPAEREVVITDTVGFIHDLPKDLVAAFKATLEELAEADLLLHLVDASADGYLDRIKAVNRILAELDLEPKPQLLVFNKIDRMDPDLAAERAHEHNAMPISALDPQSTRALLERLDQRLFFDLRQSQSQGVPRLERHLR
jgi:GTP-binding protein HflX